MHLSLALKELERGRNLRGGQSHMLLHQFHKKKNTKVLLMMVGLGISRVKAIGG